MTPERWEAARQMRGILMDRVRSHAAAGRPGAFPAPQSPGIEPLLILDEALTNLALIDARQALVAELIFFGGLKEEEVAEGLGISARTVKRDCRLARPRLSAELKRPHP